MSTQETANRISEIEVPCTNCLHNTVCKYTRTCAKTIGSFNDGIKKFNELLNGSSESQSSTDSLLTFSFESELVLGLRVSCKYKS